MLRGKIISFRNQNKILNKKTQIMGKCKCLFFHLNIHLFFFKLFKQVMIKKRNIPIFFNKTREYSRKISLNISPVYDSGNCYIIFDNQSRKREESR